MASIIAKVNGNTFDPTTGNALVPQFLSGSGVPAGSLGNLNDLYVNLTTANWYRKTGSTTWALQGSLVGPTGATGAAGSPGGTQVGGFIDPTTTDGDFIYRKAAAVTALQVGFVGDSITAGTTVTTAPPAPCAAALTQGTLTVSATNQGVSGATTTTWLPGTTNMNAAKAAFASAGVRLVNVMLGTNDSKTTGALTQAQYRTNMQAICGELIGAGYIVAVSYPPYLSAITGVFDAGSPARVASYCAAIDSLVDNLHIFHGDMTAQAYYQANPSALQADGVHPTQTGSDHLGAAWAAAVQGLVNGLSNKSVLQRATIGAGLSLSSGVLSASGGSFGTQDEIRVEILTPTAGMKKRVPIPRALQINGWYLLADVSGSAVLDIYADSYTNYPPGTSQSICGGNKPTLSSAIKNKDTTLSGWLTTLADDGALIVNVDSASTVAQLTLCLSCTRVVSGPPTVTWNPADKEANFTLSGGNLSIARAGGVNTWGGIRATLARDAATANHYFEVVAGSAQQMVGIANSSQPITASNFIGNAAGGWSHYGSSATKANNNVQTAYGTTWATSDVIGVLLKNGKLYFRKNGTWMNSADPIAETGYAFSGITGNVYPAHSLFTNGDTSASRFSASTITGSLPSGSASWGA